MQVLVIDFKFDRKWQLLRGLILLYRDWSYLYLSCLAKSNLSQAFFKICMKI